MAQEEKQGPGSAAPAAPGPSSISTAPGLPDGVSECISRLRIPLMLGPVLVHACLAPESSPLQFILARLVGDVAVPAFFFISGLLYFSSFGWTARSWSHKLVGRAKSIVIPYFIWNLAAYLAFAYAVHILAKPDFLKSFWAVRVARRGIATAPANGPLYFLKGILFLTAAAPAAGAILRRRATAWLAPAAVAFWVFSPTPALASKMSIIGSALFAFGGFAALHGRSMLGALAGGGRRARIAAVSAYIAASATAFALHAAGSGAGPARRLAVITGIGAAFALAPLARGRLGAILERHQGFGMFLFCTFDIVLVYARARWRGQLYLPADSTCLLCAAIAVAVPLAAYALLWAVAPGLLAVLTGNRAARRPRTPQAH
ncbi:MAG: acyltransferase [Kiritimatiellae bacterium]|nr:acyltransferase [Kiritimatiellia bacterium]